jgi:hypothetical protein
MAGPAPKQQAPWLKLAALGGLALSVGLGGALIYVLVVRGGTPPPPTVTQKPEPARKLDDKPIAVIDPVTRVETPPAHDGKTPPAAKKGGSAAVAARPAPIKNDGPQLSAKQRGLADLYSDGNDAVRPHAVPNVAAPDRPKAQVSQTAILGVVTQNRRSLNLCYDRVLKHDTSLKRARLMTHVKIGISGKVVDAKVVDAEYERSEIGVCIAQTIKRWNFPQAGEEYETEFPIILQAE